jgi:hypothetical protein
MTSSSYDDDDDGDDVVVIVNDADDDGEVAGMSAKRSQLHADQAAWEDNRLIQSGVAVLAQVQTDFTADEDGGRTQLIVHNLKPPFLDGRVKFSMQQTTVSVVKDSSSDMVREFIGISLIQSFTHSLTHSLHSLSHSLTHYSLTSLTHSLTHTVTHSLTHSLTHLFTRYSINQSFNQPINQSITQSLNHSITH